MSSTILRTALRAFLESSVDDTRQVHLTASVADTLAKTIVEKLISDDRDYTWNFMSIVWRCAKLAQRQDLQLEEATPEVLRTLVVTAGSLSENEVDDLRKEDPIIPPWDKIEYLVRQMFLMSVKNSGSHL